MNLIHLSIAVVLNVLAIVLVYDLVYTIYYIGIMLSVIISSTNDVSKKKLYYLNQIHDIKMRITLYKSCYDLKIFCNNVIDIVVYNNIVSV